MDRRRALTILASGAACTAGAAAVVGGYATATASPAKTAPPGAVGMLYDTTRCIGCKACVVACAEANNLEPDRAQSDGLYQAPVALNSKTKNIIKLYQSGGEQSYMKAQCMHCVDPACAAACMMHALQKDEKGIVYWDGSRCVGCRYCQVACPYNVPKFEWSSLNPKIVKCELCRHRLAEGRQPACVEVCPRQAVIYGTRAELLADAHRRLKEHPDRYIQKVYGEHDAGGTQVLYLAHVDFAKLGLPDVGERAVPETVRTVQSTIYKGFVAPVALYGLLALIVRRNRRKQLAEEPAGDATGKEL
jgi:Fe-S-cluster-containing dehydrogenase component